MLHGIDLAEVQSRHIIKILTRIFWNHLQGLLGHARLPNAQSWRCTSHMYNRMLVRVHPSFRNATAMISCNRAKQWSGLV
jgi:hypothetical protein